MDCVQSTRLKKAPFKNLPGSQSIVAPFSRSNIPLHRSCVAVGYARNLRTHIYLLTQLRPFLFVEFSQFPNRLSRKTNQKGMEEVYRYKKVPSPSWWGFMQIAVGKSLKKEKHEKESEMGGDDLSLDCCCCSRVGEVENSLSIGR